MYFKLKPGLSCLQIVLVIFGSIFLLIFILIVFSFIMAGFLQKMSGADEFWFASNAGRAVQRLNHIMEMQVMSNRKTIHGLNENGLADFFLEKMYSGKKLASNKVQEYAFTYEFHGSAPCDSGCYVKVDTNGEKGPNKVWEQGGRPSDIVIIPLLPEGASTIEQLESFKLQDETGSRISFIMGARNAISSMDMKLMVQGKDFCYQSMGGLKCYNSIDGLDAKGLADYFSDRVYPVRRLAPNKFKGDDLVIYEFYGVCNFDCYAIIDTNGEDGPNEFWESADEPKDRIKVKLTPKKVIAPEHIKASIKNELHDPAEY